MPEEYALADRAKFFYQYLSLFLYKRQLEKENTSFHAFLV